MVPKATAETLVETAVTSPKTAYVKKTLTPEFLAEQDAIMARVMEEGERRIHRSVER